MSCGDAAHCIRTDFGAPGHLDRDLVLQCLVRSVGRVSEKPKREIGFGSGFFALGRDVVMQHIALEQILGRLIIWIRIWFSNVWNRPLGRWVKNQNWK